MGVSADPESWWALGARLEVEWAPSTRSGRSQKLELRFEPELEVGLPYGLRFTALGRLRTDARDELEPGDPDLDSYSRLTRPSAMGERTELELRELYVDGSLGPAFVRIGKQQIVWGEADILKVLDVLNPQDYREFILDEFEDSRIPLWAANVEIPFASSVLQLVWIPDPTYHRIPGLDSASADPEEAYAFTAPMFRPKPPVLFDRPAEIRLASPDRPTWRWSNSDLGARLSTVWRGWDLSLNYLYHIDDAPVLSHGLVHLKLTREGIITSYDVTPRYERMTILGGTFSHTLGSLTLRGEIGYSTVWCAETSSATWWAWTGSDLQTA
jgi:hypothetical protein